MSDLVLRAVIYARPLDQHSTSQERTTKPFLQSLMIIAVVSRPTPVPADPPESFRFYDSDALERRPDLSNTSGGRLSFTVGPPFYRPLVPRQHFCPAFHMRT